VLSRPAIRRADCYAVVSAHVAGISKLRMTMLYRKARKLVRMPAATSAEAAVDG
jgi:hypothetical protein